jgi:hypothetical protein
MSSYAIAALLPTPLDGTPLRLLLEMLGVSIEEQS